MPLNFSDLRLADSGFGRPDYIMAIDSGTTSVRAIIVDEAAI